MIAWEVAKNVLAGSSLLKSWRKHAHQTGLQNDPELTRELVGFYQPHLQAWRQGGKLLELGPGQTTSVAEQLVERGHQVTALDVEDYGLHRLFNHPNYRYVVYDGGRWPIQSESHDAVLSADVLEHVRDPSGLMQEVTRVLRPGGVCIARIDLRDHLFLHDESKWRQCHRYSPRLWHSMASNRSIYVNRLGYEDWLTLGRRQGFDLVSVHTMRSQKMLQHSQSPAEDADVYRLDIVWSKPA